MNLTLQLSWSLFCKESLPGRTFTFWDWFLKILILTQCHLASLWREGHVKGFILKDEAENMLKNQLPGTFLLRFSDSALGGITIAYSQGPGGKFSQCLFYDMFMHCLLSHTRSGFCTASRARSDF